MDAGRRGCVAIIRCVRCRTFALAIKRKNRCESYGHKNLILSREDTYLIPIRLVSAKITYHPYTAQPDSLRTSRTRLWPPWIAAPSHSASSCPVHCADVSPHRMLHAFPGHRLRWYQSRDLQYRSKFFHKLFTQHTLCAPGHKEIQHRFVLVSFHHERCLADAPTSGQYRKLSGPVREFSYLLQLSYLIFPVEKPHIL